MELRVNYCSSYSTGGADVYESMITIIHSNNSHVQSNLGWKLRG